MDISQAHDAGGDAAVAAEFRQTGSELVVSSAHQGAWSNQLEGDWSAQALWLASRRSRVRSREAALMLEVLKDALRLVTGAGRYCGDESPTKKRRVNAEARAWLLGEGYNADALFSSDSICETLGIDVGGLRDRLRRGAHIRIEPEKRVVAPGPRTITVSARRV